MQESLFGRPRGPGTTTSPTTVGYRGPTACAAAGITYRQLDYWARTALVVPTVRSASGSGSQRLYSFKDILVLKVVKRLLDAGISLQNIRTAVDTLRTRGVDDLAQVTLLSDGTTVYECTSSEEVVDLLQGGQGVFGIAVSGALRELRGSLEHLPAERAEAAGIDGVEDSTPPGRRAEGRAVAAVGNSARPPPELDSYRERLLDTARESRVPPFDGTRRRRGNLPGTSQAPGPHGAGHSGGNPPDRRGRRPTFSDLRRSLPWGVIDSMIVPSTAPTLAELEHHDVFAERHIGTAGSQQAMLEALGYQDVEALLADAVPASIREKLTLALPEPASEQRGRRASCARSPAATTPLTSMIGLGLLRHRHARR